MALPDNDTKIMIGYGIGSAVAAAAVACAILGGTNAPLQVTLCLLGGALGWTVGIVLSPLDEDESTKFGTMGKAVAAVLSGFAVAKLEEPIVNEVKAALAQDGHLYSFRVALFFTLFLIGFLFTLISRLYSDDANRRREKKMDRLLAEANTAIAKYERLKSEA